MNTTKTSKLVTTIAVGLLLQAQSSLAVQGHIEFVQTGTNFTYTVFNDEVAGSPLFLDAFHLQVRAPFDVVSSPAGWVFETDGFTYIDWMCTNEVPPYPQDIAPGGSLAGFALRSKVTGTETNSFALTTWNHGGDTSGPVFLGKILGPAILSFDGSLTNLFYSRSNTFQFDLKGIPSFSYAIQSASNLTDWTSVVTNSAPFSFADTNKAVMRFYRPIFVPDSNSWPVLGD
jgi:hypothetical protein